MIDIPYAALTELPIKNGGALNRREKIKYALGGVRSYVRGSGVYVGKLVSSKLTIFI
jgi:hypothetical protein